MNREKKNKTNSEYYNRNKERINSERRESYKLDSTRILQKSKQFNDLNPEVSIFRNAKHRAKRDNIPFDIEQSDVIIPDNCPVLSIPIVRGSGKFTNNSPSIDRLKPELGYTKGNVRVISFRANLLKSDAEIWELEAVLKDLRNV